MKTLARIAVFAVLLALTIPVSTHAMAGMYTAKYVDGPNIVLLTNNVHDTRPNMPILYNLRIYDTNGKPVTFGNVQISLKRGEKILQEYNVHRTEHNDGSITLTYPKQGSYTLVTRFLDNDKQVAWGEFPIVVSKNTEQGWLTDLLSLPTAVGLVIGFGAATLISNRNRLPLPNAARKRKK